MVTEPRNRATIKLRSAKRTKFEYDDGTRPVGQSSDKTADQNRQWKIALRITKLFSHMGKSLNADKTPEHDCQRGSDRNPSFLC
ncbi:Uncharacterised protein [Vibrio cholerae]|nr:Uncharacterised protein [Vibrio cholerae]CSI40144.1 Uncharacterised protein [Vibrio cholerae]